MTEAERKLWQKLRSKQLGVKFRRQAPVGEYIVDFLSYDPKMIVELDGGQHALQHEYDAQRTVYLESEGFQVLRFWNNDVFDNLEGVLTVISEKISYPHPTPPPEGEGIGSINTSQNPSPCRRAFGEDVASPENPSPSRGSLGGGIKS